MEQRQEDKTNTNPNQSLGAEGEYGTMLQIIRSTSRCQAVYCAARFSFADHLKDGPRTADWVAQAEGLNPEATFRLMRACTSFGLMTYEPQSGFTATPLLKTLQSDDPALMRGTAISQLGPGFWLPWGSFEETLKTGQPQANSALGSSLWEYYAKPGKQEEAVGFTKSMQRVSKAIKEEAKKLISMKGVSLAVDVGGANGELVLALMQCNPEMRGAVLELPHVVPDAERTAAASGLESRFQTFAGDFFAEVPSADLYLLKNILHDWPDEKCLDILRNCRRACKPGDRLVIVEILVDATKPSDVASIYDLTMMVMFGSRERTRKEFESILEASGYRLTSVTASHTPLSFIEAKAT